LIQLYYKNKSSFSSPNHFCGGGIGGSKMQSSNLTGAPTPAKSPEPPRAEVGEGEKEREAERYREIKSQLVDVIMIVEKELKDDELAIPLWEAMKIIHGRIKELER